jgi:hypothetical protein
VRLQDSPLSAPSAAAPAAFAPIRESVSPTSRWRPAIDDSDDDAHDDDEPALAEAGTGPRRHRSRPSTVGLLGEGILQADETALSPDTVRRQRRLRSYADDEGFDVGAYVPDKLRRFGLAARGVVRKNEGEFPPFLEAPGSLSLTLLRAPGLLLIVLSQVGFAIINACVKLLEEDVAVPVYELIVIRMLITFAGCYSCEFTSLSHDVR